MRKSLVLASFLTLVTPAFAGGVAILNTVLSDNGDNDGFADTNETVSLRLNVQNTSGIALTGVTAHLYADEPGRACLTDSTIGIGNLAPGEVRLTTEAFVFHVGGNVDRTLLGLGPLDPLSVTFNVSIESGPTSQAAHPPKITLDLDLDVAGGSGPTTFFESFEDGMGTFEVQNLDAGLFSMAASDGYRCQYNDPDNPNSNQPPQQDCYLGASASHADQVFWGLSGPEISPQGGRGFTGFHSLFWGIDMGPPNNWTTPLSVLEAARTAQPINLGWDGVAPELSIKQQVSLVDGRLSTTPDGNTPDRGVVMAQVADGSGNPVGPWIKLYPHHNVYDQPTFASFINCEFDPIDDGNTEDDFYDPTDPERRYGPSSTCHPESSFVDMGETSSAFNAGHVGRADGPGLQGLWGIGTWVESKFDLDRFRGRRVRVRFLATSIKVGTFEDYQELYAWNPAPGDDGWWIDDVTVTGALVDAPSAVVDAHDNSSLPGGPGDGDADGVGDTCDNCAAAGNATQIDRDRDEVGNVCDVCPYDVPPHDPDADTLCSHDDNCPQTANLDQVNADGDAAGAACDCDDASSYRVYPGAEEVNDGFDNQCPGEAGYGVADEMGLMGFLSKTTLYWFRQTGATHYQVARAQNPTYSSACTLFPQTPFFEFTDNTPLQPGRVFYYMVRARQPNLGSWGQDSAGVERNIPCD